MYAGSAHSDLLVVVVVVVEAFALQQLSVSVSSWEELVSKRE